MISGLGTIKKNLTFSTKILRRNADRGIVIGLLMIKKRAQQNIPVREGNLRSSGFTVMPSGVKEGGGGFKSILSSEIPKLDAAHVKAKADVNAEVSRRSRIGRLVGAVAFSAPYATYVHEYALAGLPGYDPRLDVKGLPARYVHSKVGAWKFLENAVKSEKTVAFLALKKELRFFD